MSLHDLKLKIFKFASKQKQSLPSYIPFKKFFCFFVFFDSNMNIICIPLHYNYITIPSNGVRDGNWSDLNGICPEPLLLGVGFGRVWFFIN